MATKKQTQQNRATTLEAYIQAQQAEAARLEPTVERRKRALNKEVEDLYKAAAMKVAKSLKLPKPMVSDTAGINWYRTWGNAAPVSPKGRCTIRFSMGRGKPSGKMTTLVSIPAETRKRINREVKKVRADQAQVARWSRNKTFPQHRKDALHELLVAEPELAAKITGMLDRALKKRRASRG